MKVFKFGGASIKNDASIRNMYDIISIYREEQLVIVVSAMGKTTNQLEKIVGLAIESKPYKDQLDQLYQYHVDVATNLFNKKRATDRVQRVLESLKNTLAAYPSFPEKDMFYDAVVSHGELLSSTIIAEYLELSEIKIHWLDARDFIKTDDTFREGKVNWSLTRNLINEKFRTPKKNSMIITQGFIASTENHHTTTLGREGSDFTAAIIASCLQAESVTIWKDVPGILNADPKKFASTQLYRNLSYQEAAEMTYYGASVIHPKTIKPLANNKIPLLVRSFENPFLEGTVIDIGEIHELPPTFIIKENQCLITFRVRDLAFISEKNLSIIFHVLDMLNIKINMMQNSAVSFTICVDGYDSRIEKLIDTLKNDFNILYNDQLTLITIKNYTMAAVDTIVEGKNILVEQRTRNTCQIVIGS